jgi:hypothetical protein
MVTSLIQDRDPVGTQPFGLDSCSTDKMPDYVRPVGSSSRDPISTFRSSHQHSVGMLKVMATSGNRGPHPRGL